MKRWLRLRTIVILGVVLFVVGAFIARWEAERFRVAEYGTFTEQNIQVASHFARSAGTWLVNGNDAAIEGAAGLLLAGSGQYVRITMEGIVVLDKQAEGSLEPPADPFGVSSLESVPGPQHVLRRDGLDVMIPIELTGWLASDVGAIQIGFSDAQARFRVSGYRRLVVLLAVGSWLALLLVVLLAGRIVTLRERLTDSQNSDASRDPIIHCGALEIDTDTCAVRLSGTTIEMTPKMFELLSFLARNVGKTYSDSALLKALWSDAPYAASGDVKQCIYMLRRRLGTACSDPKQIIVNVKGFGYKLEPPTEAVLSND